jgi:Lysozyme like domain
MTAWNGRSIAEFARRAGFYGDDVKIATAIALAASGGHDSYDVQAGVPGAGHWQGLWAIDTDLWPEHADLDLHVPQTNAKAAYQSTIMSNGYDWSAVYRNNVYRMFLDHAGTEASYMPFTGDGNTSTGAEAFENQRVALRGRLSSLRRHPTFGGL